LLSIASFGQNAYEVFGNNRVQYKQWNWKYITTEHFTIYYYVGGNNIAYNASRFAETELKRIIEITGYTPHEKMVMMIYNSVEDMQMSNVDLTRKAFIGGETELKKSRFEVAYPGTQIGFKQGISEGLTKLMLEVMLFGGSLRNQLQSSYLMNIAPWFLDGAAKYISEGWSPALSDVIKSDLINRKKKLKNFVGNDATLIGQSIWNYIAVEYGEENIANILNLTYITKKSTSSIENTLGIPFKNFVDLWRGYYLSLSDSLAEQAISPSKKLKVRKHNRKGRLIKQVHFSPSGKKVAYTENFLGRYKVKILDTETGRKKTFHKVGRRITDRPLNLNLPLLAWQTDTSLAMVVYKRGKVSFLMKNTDNNHLAESGYRVLDEILGIDFSDDGRWVVYSALKDGQTDLFQYDYKRNLFKRLTFDLYDDIHPSFLKGSNTKIVFSSNRLDTLLKAKDRGSFDKITNDFDLYLLDIERKDTVKRLTYLEGKENYPQSLNNDELVFTNTLGQQLSLYKMNWHNPEQVSLISNYKKNINSFSVNDQNGSLSFMMEDKNRNYLFLEPSYDFDHVYAVRENLPPVPKEDTLSQTEAIKPFPLLSELNVDDYFFESESKLFNTAKEQARKDSLAEIEANKIRIRGPYNYKLLLGIDHMVNTPFFDQLRGFGVLQDITTTELFGDHRFNAGYFGDFANLNVGLLYGEYQYLRRRVDFGVRYEREGIISNGAGQDGSNGEAASQKYFLNSFLLSASYPFTPSTRVSVSPGYERTSFDDISLVGGSFDFSDNTIHQNYLSLKTEFVIDNTYEKGLNQLLGSRMKLVYKSYTSLGDKNQNFARLYLDARNYMKIHKGINFATRLTAGKFIGNAKKNFLLGGMDNWLNQQTANNPLANFDESSTDINERDQSAVLFQEYITSLRGYHYSERTGNNVILFNAELRIPLFQYLYNRPINSAVLRNFQLIGFTDAGTAWSGKGFNIYSDENLFETVNLSSNDISAEVKRYRGSILYSYGLGVRSTVSSYYLKIDVAWPKKMFPTDQKPALHLSFGYDF